MKNATNEKKAKEIEPLLGYEDISKMTGLTVAFLTKARREYGLPSFKLGGSVKFRLSEVEKWINDRKQTA